MNEWWPALVAVPFFVASVLSLHNAMESEGCGTKLFFYAMMILLLIPVVLVAISLVSGS